MQETNTQSMLAGLWGIGRKTTRWEKEGLLSPAQAHAIIAFEKRRQGIRFMRSLAGLALLAIALGVLSLVAANWVHLSPEVKIGGHFLLNIAAAFAVKKADAKGNALWREGATFLLFALNLTLIALIGQVYQLSGSWAGAFGLWMLISTPAVFMYGQSALNAIAWLAGFFATVYLVAFDWLHDAGDFTILLAMLSIGLYMPLLLTAAGLSARCRAARPAWAVASFRLAVALFTLGATAASFTWYVDLGRGFSRLFLSNGSFESGYIILASVCLSAPLAVIAYAALKRRLHGPDSVDSNGVLFVCGSLVSIIAPLLLLGDENSVLAALHFIAYWSFAGWIGYRLGYNRLVSNAVTLVCLRIIIIYCELFSSLLVTGFGLIGSGILLLLFLRAVVSFKKKLGGENA